MNVLHISESDAAGGAARTAYKVHRGLKEQGHVSRMLVGRKVTADDDIRRIKRHDGWRAADRVFGAVLDLLDLQYAFYPSSFGVASDPWFRGADVVQLHNLHGSYFSYTALPLLSRRRPIVWLLQDQWAYTGHVAYSLDCERWRHGCGSCPYLSEYPRLRLPGDRPLVLFSASDLNEPRKGLHLLEEALVRMDDPPLLALAGAGEIPRRVETVWLGSIADDEVLAHAYSAADVLAVPTVADALTQTAIESIACGTPCVAFDRGGVTDVVTNETGYQARFGDVDDLAHGLRVVLDEHDRYAPRCRAIAEQEFTVDLQVRRYVELYEQVLAAA